MQLVLEQGIQTLFAVHRVEAWEEALAMKPTQLTPIKSQMLLQFRLEVVMEKNKASKSPWNNVTKTKLLLSSHQEDEKQQRLARIASDRVYHEQYLNNIWITHVSMTPRPSASSKSSILSTSRSLLLGLGKLALYDPGLIVLLDALAIGSSANNHRQVVSKDRQGTTWEHVWKYFGSVLHFYRFKII